MPDPKQVRLQTDYDKIKTLVAESGGTLKLIRTNGLPPTTYVIEYHCPSLFKDAPGKLTTRTQHQVEINLGSSYPFTAPSARMLTPVFNPHVWEHNAICLGSRWSPGETLDTLILRIGALLQLDPKVLDPHSPANGEANQWVQKNKSHIPLGSVTFKAPVPAKKQIKWN